MVLEWRPQGAVSHEVGRRGQGASRGAPGKSGTKGTRGSATHCVRPPTLSRSTSVSGLRLYHGARLCPASDTITEHVCVRPPTLQRSTAVSGLRLYHGARLCPASDSITEHVCVRPPTLSQSTASNHLSRPMKDEPGGARRPLGPPDQLPQVSASMVLRPLFLPCRDRLVVAMR